jgi:hypothetical protein
MTERVVQVVEVTSQRVTSQRANEPELLVVAHVGEVPHEWRHQRRVLREQEVLVERREQVERASASRFERRRHVGGQVHAGTSPLDSRRRRS